MKCKQLALRVLSTAAILSIVSSIAAPVFAETYYIGNGHDLKIEAKDDGKVYVNDHEDKDGEITIKGSAGEDSLSKKNEENKEQETGENGGAEKKTVTEETPGEKTSAEEGETKKQDTPSENSDEGKDSANEKNENKKDDVPSAGENPQLGDTAEPEEEMIKKGSASGSENAPKALQSTVATRSAPAENTSVENSPVSNVINVVNNWADKILKITLDNVNIKVNKDDDKAAMSVSGSGDTEVDLVGDNVLDSSQSSCHAGLEKAWTVDNTGKETSDGGKLIIDASDNEQGLTAKGTYYAAGIGGRSYGIPNSKAEITGIEINGGKINATAASGGGAGIGGGSWTIGEVTINGGDITATGGQGGGAGIGGGKNNVGFVTINEGTINATSGNNEGFGIGNGRYGDGGEVEINGGNITASSKVCAAGIGGKHATVTITNGTVCATGGTNSGGTTGGGAGIGGYGANITITGGNVTAIGTEGGAGIGNPGDYRGIDPGRIEISGNAQVTATGGAAANGYGSGAAIGYGGAKNNVDGEEVDVIADGMNSGSIVRNPAGTSADHQHTWKVTSHEDATTEHGGKTEYICTGCGADRTDYFTALPENGINSEAGYAPLTVLGADSFEQTTENDRLIITVPEESASLTGSLEALRELESSGIQTLVFRTRHCESSVRLADLTAQGSDEAVFVLSHSGENASLTLDGRDLTGLLA